jgi:hypothetical protein
MKLIVVFIVGWGLTAPIFAQDTLVCVKPSTARFFLEFHDKALILQQKDSVNTKLIENLDTQLSLKDSVISSYQQDSLLYREERQLSDDLLRIHKKEEKRLKRTLGLTRIGALVLLGLILIIK